MHLAIAIFALFTTAIIIPVNGLGIETNNNNNNIQDDVSGGTFPTRTASTAAAADSHQQATKPLRRRTLKASSSTKLTDYFYDAIKDYKENGSCDINICGATFDKDIKLTKDYVCDNGVSGPTLINGAKLDCDGYSITGGGRGLVGGGGIGVTLVGDYTQVMNCDISNFNLGIYTSSSAAIGEQMKIHNVKVHQNIVGISHQSPTTSSFGGLILKKVVAVNNDQIGLDILSDVAVVEDIFACNNNVANGGYQDVNWSLSLAFNGQDKGNIICGKSNNGGEANNCEFPSNINKSYCDHVCSS